MNCIRLLILTSPLKQEGAVVSLERPTDQKRHKAMHGLYRALIANMIEGVSKGYKTSIGISWCGYKANAQSNVLELSLGYSHNVFLAVPSEIKVQTFRKKDKILRSFWKESTSN